MNAPALTRLPGRAAPRVLLMLLGAVILVIALPLPWALACSCDPSTVEEAIEERDLIATGVATGVLSEDGGAVTYAMTLVTVWKGEEVGTIRFTTNEEPVSCGLGRLTVGEEVRLWATGAGGEYSMTWCAIPAEGLEIDVDAQLTAALGEPWENPDPGLPGTGAGTGGGGCGSQGTGGGTGDPDPRAGCDQTTTDEPAPSPDPVGTGDDSGPNLLVTGLAIAIPVLLLGGTAVAITVFLLWYARRP